MDKWISVDTGLPEDGKLICGININSHQIFTQSRIWVETWDEEEPIGRMTHWFLVPDLPEPPK